MNGGVPLTSSNTRKEQALETRKKLLASAQTLFASKGYEGTSVRMINQQIHMANGLLYHYFPGGKQEILQVMVKEHVLAMSTALTKDIEIYDETSIEEVLEQLYHHLHSVVLEHVDIIKILIKDGEAMKLIERQELIDILEERKHWLPALFQKRIDSGELKAMDCESASEVSMSLLMSHLLAEVITGEDSCMANEIKRKQLFRYLSDMWKNCK